MRRFVLIIKHNDRAGRIIIAIGLSEVVFFFFFFRASLLPEFLLFFAVFNLVVIQYSLMSVCGSAAVGGSWGWLRRPPVNKGLPRTMNHHCKTSFALS